MDYFDQIDSIMKRLVDACYIRNSNYKQKFQSKDLFNFHYRLCSEFGTNGSGNEITIKPGNQYMSDSGGVLFVQPVISANRTASSGYTSFDFEIIPNPVKEQTEARFYLTENQSVDLVMMDMTGRIVKTILKNTYLESGVHHQTILTDGLSAGTYLCRLTTQGVEHTRKIVIMTE